MISINMFSDEKCNAIKIACLPKLTYNLKTLLVKSLVGFFLLLQTRYFYKKKMKINKNLSKYLKSQMHVKWRIISLHTLKQNVYKCK